MTCTSINGGGKVKHCFLLLRKSTPQKCSFLALQFDNLETTAHFYSWVYWKLIFIYCRSAYIGLTATGRHGCRHICYPRRRRVKMIVRKHLKKTLNSIKKLIGFLIAKFWRSRLFHDIFLRCVRREFTCRYYFSRGAKLFDKQLYFFEFVC